MRAKLLERATLEYSTANTVFYSRKFFSPRVTTILLNDHQQYCYFMGGLLLYLVMRPEECELSPQRLDLIYYDSPRIFRMSLLANSS